MQDMIKRIVEMDQKAQDMTIEAREARIRTEKELAQRRKQIREELLAKARQRLGVNEETERKIAEESWQIVKARQEAASKKLEEDYARNGDRWVSEITARVLGE